MRGNAAAVCARPPVAAIICAATAADAAMAKGALAACDCCCCMARAETAGCETRPKRVVCEQRVISPLLLLACADASCAPPLCLFALSFRCRFLLLRSSPSLRSIEFKFAAPQTSRGRRTASKHTSGTHVRRCSCLSLICHMSLRRCVVSLASSVWRPAAAAVRACSDVAEEESRGEGDAAIAEGGRRRRTQRRTHARSAAL